MMMKLHLGGVWEIFKADTDWKESNGDKAGLKGFIGSGDNYDIFFYKFSEGVSEF